MFRPLSVVLVVLCALSACAGDDDAADRAEAPAARAVTTTSTVVDEWAVPDPVTPEYVERVLTELYRIEGQARRRTQNLGAVDDTVMAILDEAFTSSEAAVVANSLSRGAYDGFPDLREEPGQAWPAVSRLRTVTSECISVDGTLSYTDVVVSPPAPATVVVGLRTAKRNETGWIIESASAVGPDGAVPADPCA